MGMDEGARLARTHVGIDAHRIEFTGSGGEYFRVWIVNLLLTVVTLGVYTPFAHRRTARYFYSHTVVAGSPLEFTATGGRMLLGFLLVVGLYIAFNIASGTDQQVATALMLVGGAVLAPYLWASAMRFRMSSTRWRGVRLQFAASWPQVYRAAWPMLVIALVWFVVSVTMAIIAPPGRPPKVEPSTGQLAILCAVLGGGLLLSLLAAVVLDYQAKCLVVQHGRIGGQAAAGSPICPTSSASGWRPPACSSPACWAWPLSPACWSSLPWARCAAAGRRGPVSSSRSSRCWSSC